MFWWDRVRFELTISSDAVEVRSTTCRQVSNGSIELRRCDLDFITSSMKVWTPVGLQLVLSFPDGGTPRKPGADLN